jgi:hypothetical protein
MAKAQSAYARPLARVAGRACWAAGHRRERRVDSHPVRSHRAPAPRRNRPAPRAAPPDLVQAVVEVIAHGELDSELGVLSAVITQRAHPRTPAT